MSLSHWLLVALVVLLLFGGSRLGDIGKGLGEGIRNFKKGITDDDKPAPPPRVPGASAAADAPADAPAVTDATVIDEKQQKS
jgi:sec-independent protein translocase protein TatA